MDFPSPRNLHHISSRGLFQIVEVIPYLRIDANPYKEENLFTLFLMQGIIRKQHYLTTHHSPLTLSKDPSWTALQGPS